jgi:Phage major capsid protein E
MTIGLGLPQDRLVRKEVSLGLVREFEQPQDHIGLSIAPFQSVESDDVIFDITQGQVSGLAPARAEDAESEMAGKDDTYASGRASIIDWAIKDHYDPSDVSRYQEAFLMQSSLPVGSMPLTIDRMIDGFQEKLARDTARRRKLLDNRIEWLIMSAIATGQIVYNDGRIKFTADFGRPAAQTDAATASSYYWSDATNADPIGDIITMQQYMYDTHGVNMDRAIISRKILRNAFKSAKFTNNLIGANPLYTVAGWGDQAGLDFISSQTGVNFTIYDAVYRTRALGSKTIVNNRFTADNVAIFLPSANDVATLDDAIGFGKTLTSPHAEGNFTAGFYEWEKDTKDPWSHDMGTGIKAFPVFPHLDLTYTMRVLA